MAGSPHYKQLLIDAWTLHVAKNAGYAGADNPDPWANFRMAEDFGISAVDGCLVRMTDKYIRIKNLKQNPANDRVNESIRDTLSDLAAYALIAICLLDEEQANVSNEQVPVTSGTNNSAPSESTVQSSDPWSGFGGGSG